MPKILIVDDQPQFRRTLRLALGIRGYETREAANGADALVILRTEAPDLLLVDWQMPDISGVQLCRAIRAANDLPIIMITFKPDGRSEAIAAGANDYVRKPFGVAELLTHIECALAEPQRPPM